MSVKVRKKLKEIGQEFRSSHGAPRYGTDYIKVKYVHVKFVNEERVRMYRIRGQDRHGIR